MTDTNHEPYWVTICPNCGRQTTTLQIERNYREIWPLERIWPGGPLVQIRDQLPQMRLDSNTLSLHPCGCQITWPNDGTQPPSIRQIDLNHPDNQEDRP
jgi:hypothetical protein